MKSIFCCILSIALLGSTACLSHTSTIRLAGAAPYPETDPDTVAIYLAEKDVPGEFSKIALLYAEELGLRMTFKQLVVRMKIKAAKAGANGLILGDLEQRVDVSGGDANPVSLATDKILKGVAIHIKK